MAEPRTLVRRLYFDLIGLPPSPERVEAFVSSPTQDAYEEAFGEKVRALAERTTGALRMLDGITLLGLYQIPKHVRAAIAEETRVYTLNEPPKFFGQGTKNTGASAS